MENPNKPADALWLKFRLAMVAGIAISIGCVVFLNVKGPVGAILFSFGLITCVYFKLPLYTGTAGFINKAYELGTLSVILAGNIAGCLLMALAIRYALPHIPDLATEITAKRAVLAAPKACILGVFCGFMMTTAVKFGREKAFLPLLFAVPVFIVCGFIHSIADAFYILVSSTDVLSESASPIFLNYIMVVIGNFIGCNLYRIFAWRMAYD